MVDKFLKKSTCSASSWKRIRRAFQWQPVALVNVMPRRAKALLDNDGLTKYWQRTWCVYFWKLSLRGLLNFAARDLDVNGYVFSYFTGKIILLCNVSSIYSTFHCVNVILPVLSHEEIYLNICKNKRGVLTFVAGYIVVLLRSYSVFPGIKWKVWFRFMHSTLCLYVSLPTVTMSAPGP